MLYIRLLIAVTTVVVLLGCGGSTTPTTHSVPPWKFVTGGWVNPHGEDPGPFSEELRAVVITDQEQMGDFFNSFTTIVSRGTTTSLGRVDFPNSILLAAYYIWRPLQGEPLSVRGLAVEGTRAIVRLELEESPQGKEYPYLFAPLEVVTVERSLFPADQPVEFVFELNGDPKVTVVATVN